MKTTFYFFLLFATQLIFGQKIVQKTVVKPNIKSVQIDVSKCYTLNITTANTNEMHIEATFDGEYQKDLLLVIDEQKSSIMVDTKFQPSFIHPNDKLSAHKVIAIDLKMVLPENLNITAYGTSCDITATGKYKNLKLVASEGDCFLVNVSKNVEVTTQQGNISISAKSGTFILENKFGFIQKDNIPKGNNLFNLTTTSGNINLKKIE